MKFRFYKICNHYCEYLRGYDNIVPLVSGNKQNRPFVGIVLKINNINYYAPLSSPKPKHITMKNAEDFIKIDGGNFGVINLNNMIPVPDHCLIQVDMKANTEDSRELRSYKLMIKNQLSWCNKTENRDKIRKKAEKLYHKIINETAREELKRRCCNFKLNEQNYINYMK